jgi:hypothetical protein
VACSFAGAPPKPPERAWLQVVDKSMTAWE